MAAEKAAAELAEAARIEEEARCKEEEKQKRIASEILKILKNQSKMLNNKLLN